MTVSRSVSAKKMATLGLAGTVLTTSVTGVAAGAEPVKPTELDAFECEVDTTGSPVAPTEAEHRAAEQEVARQEAQVQAAQQDLAQQTQAVTDAQDDLDVATQAQTSEQQREDEARQRAQRELDAQQAELAAQEEAARAAQEEAERELEAQEAEKTAAEATLADARTQENQAQAAVNRAQEVAQEASTPEDRPGENQLPQASDIQSRINELNAQAAQLRESIAAKNQQIADLTEQRNQAFLAATAARDEHAAAVENLEGAQDREVHLDTLKSDADEAVAQAEEALREAQASQGANSQEIQDKQAELQRAEEEAEQASNDLGTQLNEIARLEAQATQAQNDAQRLTAEKQAAEQAQTQLANQLAAVTNEVSAEQQKLDQKLVEIERLTAQLNDINTRLAPEEAADPTLEAYTRDDLVSPANAGTQPTGTQTKASATLKANRQQAFDNYMKLLPYATRDAIIRAANSLADDDPLVTKVLTAVTPTVDGIVTSDTARDQETIDGLILHFEDDTVERRALAYDNRTAHNTALGHYYMAGGLPYTPDQLDAVDPGLTSDLANELRAITWEDIQPTDIMSDAQWKKIVAARVKSDAAEALKNNQPAPTPAQSEANALADLRGTLYLREPFTAQQDALEEQLNDLIAREMGKAKNDFDREALVQKIRDKKKNLLLGLAYANKWYDIDFNGVNLRDVLVMRRQIEGASESPVDLLIRLGSDVKFLDPQKNVTTYDTLHKPATGQALPTYLDTLRRQYTGYENFNDWFKATSKAYIVEAPSEVMLDRDVSITERLTRMGDLHKTLLPLLTVKDNTVWAMSHISGLSMGSFEKYYDAKTITDPALVEENIERIKEKVRVTALKLRQYYDLWYKIGDDRMKEGLKRDILAFDGYMRPGGWADKYGPNTTDAVEEVFGPIGRWVAFMSGVAGYANGSAVYMVSEGMLNAGVGGLSTFVHEQVHNMDSTVFLGAEGRRTGSRAELYPTALLQNPHNRSKDIWGFNQADWFGEQDPASGYLHNLHPSRFQTMTDLEQYFKGYFDTLYMLDNVEAEVLLKQPNIVKANMLAHLGNHAYQGRRHLNSYDKLTEADVASMNLRSIQDLIDNELMLARGYDISGKVLSENGYYYIRVLSPFYGTAESDLGITGESAFRRNAFELLAAKGFDAGWVPYVSNKLAKEAAQAGKPNLPDTFIMEKIFAEDGITTLKEYRKRAYAENRERARTQMKPITITYEGQEFTFTTYDEIVKKMTSVMRDDLRVGYQNYPERSKTFAFKKALFSALMAQTNEFRTSIFKDGDAALVPWTEPAAETPLPLDPPTPTVSPELEIENERFDTATLPVPRNKKLYADLTKQRAAVTTKLATAQQAKDAQQTKVDAATQRRATTADSLAQKQAQVASLTNDIAAANDRKAALDQQIAQTDAAITEAQNRRIAAEARAAELRRELSQANESVEAARQRLAEARANAAQAASELSDAQQAVTDAQNAVNAATAKVDATRQAAIEADRRLVDALGELQQFNEQQTANQSERDRLTALRDKLEDLAVAQRALTDAQGATAAAQDAVNAAQDAVNRAQTQVDRAQQGLQTAQDTRAALAGQSVDSLVTDDSPAANYPSLLSAISDLRRATVDRERAQARKSAAQATLDQAQAQLADKRDALATAQQGLAAAQAERDRLRQLQAQADAHPPVHGCVTLIPPVVDLPVAEFGVSSDNPPVVDLPVAEFGMSSKNPPVINLPIADVPVQIPGLGTLLLNGQSPTAQAGQIHAQQRAEGHTQPSGSLDAPVYDVPGMVTSHKSAQGGRPTLAETGAPSGLIGTAALAAAAAGVLISRRRRDS